MSDFSQLILIVGPSGTGKTSIVRHLLSTFPVLSFSISATTRAARKTEKNGRDYYFIGEEDFRRRVEEGAFLEWAMVYEGIYYGTLLSEINRINAQGKVPLLEIDVSGAIDILKRYKTGIYSLFLIPPSIPALCARLVARGTESPELIEDRIKKANYELLLEEKEGLFHERIVNDVWEDCREEVTKKISAYLYPPNA